MKQSLLLTGLVLTVVAIPHTMASEMIAIQPISTDAIEKISLPYPGMDKTYVYDRDAVKQLNAESSNLVEVSCQSDDILRRLWMQQGKLSLTTIGFTQDRMDMNIDMRNCSFYAGRSVWNQVSEGITDQKALRTAQSFVDSVLGANGMISVPTLGKPVITWRENGGMISPMVKMEGTTSSSPAGQLVTNSDTPERIEIQYTSMTIVYPYVLNGTAVYNNYG